MKHCYGICNGAIIYRLLWNIPQNLEDRSSCSQMFFQTGVLNNFAIFTGKHLCWSLFMIKLKAWRPTTILKIDRKTDVFLWKLFRTLFLQNTTGGCFWEENTCFKAFLFTFTEVAAWNFIERLQQIVFSGISAKFFRTSFLYNTLRQLFVLFQFSIHILSLKWPLKLRIRVYFAQILEVEFNSDSMIHVISLGPSIQFS